MFSTPGQPFFAPPAWQSLRETGGAWSGDMLFDLKAKAEKYESKVAQCEEWARQAPDGAQRAFYKVLADYYGNLATDFRQVLAKRQFA